jgi:hypothetical protein
MLIRILYRLAAVFFALGAAVCLAITVICVVGMIVEPEPKLLGIGLWAGVLTYFLGDTAKGAWRTGRYDPLFDA